MMATKLWPAFFGRVAPEQPMSECIDDVFKRALSISDLLPTSDISLRRAY